MITERRKTVFFLLERLGIIWDRSEYSIDRSISKKIKENLDQSFGLWTVSFFI